MNFKKLSALNNQGFFPFKTLFIVILVWISLAALNYFSIRYWKFTGADILFPFSVIYPSAFLWTGFLFASLFFLMGIFSYKYLNNFSFLMLFFVCILLVLVGNLSQGNFDIAFMQPFYLKGRQYYEDAVRIRSASLWLQNFTDHQSNFQMHTSTHPPFITLLHYFFLKIFNGSILGLGFVFFGLSSIFFAIFNKILFYLKFSHFRRKQILLFSAIVPSINIYLLVSVDGLILTTSSLMILGISRMLYKNKIDFLSFLFCFLSIFLTNLMSYSGLFLLAFLGFYSLVCIFVHKRFDFTIVTILSFLLSVVLFFSIYYEFGYDHFKAFKNASLSENPKGFLLLSNPYIYMWTRLQDVGEILIFLSLGFVALFFAGKNYFSELFSCKINNEIIISAFFSLTLMFLSGAYGTGETARACLFIVPFFLLLLKNLKDKTFETVFFLCLVQTFGMQLIGNFYW
jgi:hypothetical protein